jgi:RES domain-containing protein
MQVYRISKSAFAEDLNGTGAALYGGRWNPKGFSMLYTAGSISLAVLEYMAHNFHLMPSLELTLSIISLPDTTSYETIKAEDLPPRWHKPLTSHQFTQGLGAEFLKAKRAYAMKVPSAIIPNEYNILLNPLHISHRDTTIDEKITPFKLDERIFGLM